MRKLRNVVLLLMLPVVALHAQENTFCSNLTTVERVSALIQQLTLEEKASLMLYNSPAIERLGIPAYNWWNESLHGVGRAGRATVFPQPIAMASTFNEVLIEEIAAAIGNEARIKHRKAVLQGFRGQYAGLSFWTPNVNIFRDPRWGRGQETWGEDPWLTSVMGAAFVRGLQGNDSEHLRVAACAKHFAVHSGPESSRHRYNAVPDSSDLYNSYLPAFRVLVDAGVESVMCAYNRLYGEPCCSSHFLHDILRRQWGFKGHVVTDCWALDDIWQRHKVTDDKVEAAVMAARAGVSLNCGYLYQYLPQAVDEGRIGETLIDSCLMPLLMTRAKLGLLSSKEVSPWDAVNDSLLCSHTHRALSLEAAQQAVVLLKNRAGVLPLSDTLHKLFIAGPNAASMEALLGNYNGFSENMVTFLEGVVGHVDAGTMVDYSMGCSLTDTGVIHGMWQAGMADVSIVFVGLSPLIEGEGGDAMFSAYGGDRAELTLPKGQINYVKALRKSMGDKPLILVVVSGSAIAMPEIAGLADAVLWTGYPGEQGGNAMAQVLFGEVNPSGRLPVTFYHSVEDLPAFDDYTFKNRTYRYFTGIPQYAFGYGLSYTTFQYEKMFSDRMEYRDNDTIRLKIHLTNSGNRVGAEVVQVYARRLFKGCDAPCSALSGVARVQLLPQQDSIVNIAVPVRCLALYDKDTYQTEVGAGAYEISVGAASDDIRLHHTIAIKEE